MPLCPDTKSCEGQLLCNPLLRTRPASKLSDDQPSSKETVSYLYMNLKKKIIYISIPFFYY